MSKSFLSVVGIFALVMPLPAQQPEALPAGAMRRWKHDALVNHAALSPDARLLAAAAGMGRAFPRTSANELPSWMTRTSSSVKRQRPT
jgi:hypothetical protein